MNSRLVRDRMKLLGLTQYALAEQLGVPRDRVASWVNNRSVIQPRDAIALADALGLSLDQLLRVPDEQAAS